MSVQERDSGLAWPEPVLIEVGRDGCALVTVGGIRQQVAHPDWREAKRLAYGAAATTARTLGHPVTVDVRDVEGAQRVLVDRDGQVLDPLSVGDKGGLAVLDRVSVPAEMPLPTVVAPTGPPAMAMPGPQPLMMVAAARAMTPGGPSGWDGLLQSPSAAPVRARRGRETTDPRAGTAWSWPHIVVVANPAGSARKTTTAALLAGAFGTMTPSPPALIDASPTGNLRDRLEVAGPPMGTLADVVDHLDEYDGQDPLWAARWLTWQPSSRFQALASRLEDTIVTEDGQVTLADATVPQFAFVKVIEAVGRMHRIIVVDMGNSLRDAVWRGAMEVAEVLVVPTDWSDKACRGAARLMSTLTRTGRADLVHTAVLFGGGAGRWSTTRSPARRDLEELCRSEGVATLECPYAKTLVSGPVVFPDQPAPVRQAGLRLASAVWERFAAREVSARRWAA